MLLKLLRTLPKLRNPFITIATLTTITTTTKTPLLISLLKQCNSLPNTKCVHQQLLVRGGLLNNAADIVGMYIACEAPVYALTVLERLAPCPFTVFWWNNLIKRDVKLGLLHDSFKLYVKMVSLGWRADCYTFPFVLKACGEIPSFRRGSSVHAVVVSNGLDLNVFVSNGLVSMYSKCGALDDCQQVFDEMREREVVDLVSWNSIVAAYMQSGDFCTALEMFVEMGLRPDAVSLVNILPACASVARLMQGKQVHAFAFRSGLLDDVFLGNAVMDVYAKCGLISEAKAVFELMEDKDLVSWNVMVTGYSQSGSFREALVLIEKMRERRIQLNVVTWSAVIAGYAQRGLGFEALDVFREMQLVGSAPNAVTLASLLSGCAAVRALIHGKETHGYAIKCILKQDYGDIGNDHMVNNALIDMYAKCRSANYTRAIFELLTLRERNVVTWTVMIGGHAQYGDANSALELFSEMLRGANTPNGFTISCSLMACARLGGLRSGKEIHAFVIRNRYESVMLFVANCLIDMYSKCGDVDAARNVFDGMLQKNDISWTSLMTGYGIHGRGEKAIQVFDTMQEAGFALDGVTFVVVLYACSHCGMIDLGIKYFNSMETKYGVVKGVEHFACMVDLLGRAGWLDRAMELINGMPMEPTPVVWVALLSACRVHGNVELGEYAAEKLLQLEYENDGSYTLLSNMYAKAGRWKDVARTRSLMKKSGIRKKPGCSWVQGRKGTAHFFVGDRSHPQSQQMYELLADLIRRIKIIGYKPETRFALHDVDEEEKRDLLFEHSEKLALAYGILISVPGEPIRITKNLRVCGDCHSAITFISKIVDHEIILRDSSRFHHFKNGSCSCKGYW